MKNLLNIEAEPFEFYSESDEFEEEFDTESADEAWHGETNRNSPGNLSMNEFHSPRLPFEALEFTDLEFTDQESPSNLTRQVPKTIWRNNTDLDAPYFGGNFNFLYHGGANEALITFNTYLSYRGKYTQPQKDKFEENLRQAVERVWDSAAEVQVRNINGHYNDRIKLRFKLQIVRDPKNANKKTDIFPDGSKATWLPTGKGHEIVMRNLNVFIGSRRNVLVHELGHVWGLLDEYDAGWVQKKLPGHVGSGSPLIKDKIAIMNVGYERSYGNAGELRGRYFKHFGRAILNSFWGLQNHVIPIRQNGRVVSRSVQGRIVLLKKNIAGSPPYANDVLPFNPRFTEIHVAKR